MNIYIWVLFGFIGYILLCKWDNKFSLSTLPGALIFGPIGFILIVCGYIYHKKIKKVN